MFHFKKSFADTYSQSSIIIRNCEFHNIFYEMSSLIILPVSNESFSIALESNLFRGFTSCGSLLSNNMEITESSLNNAYYSSNGPSNQSTESKIDIKGNIFTHFNVLKKRETDLIQERKEQAVGTVNSTSLQNRGMIIEIQGGEYMVIDVTQNKFVNIVQHYGIWNGQQYDLCSQILNSLSKVGLLYQLTHLISIQNSQNSRIVIGSNNFTNLSTTGPLIFMEDNADSNQYVIIQNNFTLIHGYVNSNAIQVQRKGIQIGGNLLISGNHFSEIAGCPTVQAGAIMVGIISKIFIKL